MGLSDRLADQALRLEPGAGRRTIATPGVSPVTARYRQRIHQRLLDELGPTLGDPRMTGESLHQVVGETLTRVLDEERLPLSVGEQERLRGAVYDDVFGFGPLDPLLADEAVTEVMCNGPDAVWVERQGRLERTPTTFVDADHLRRVIEKMVGAVGRRVDEMTPVCDARLASGARVHAVLAPVAVDGPFLTIRKFARDHLTAADLVRSRSLDDHAMQFLSRVVKGRCNVLISGGAGSGKTTLLNVLSSFIPKGERIVTIEDSKELQLRQDHVLSLESRQPNVEGQGLISIRDLVRTSLRMRPDRIVVGEVRAGEALDMLQAMNTGHDGSLTTVHANSPRDALTRIETLVFMAGYELPLRAIRQQIASSIEVLVHLQRQSDGSRWVTHITEVQGMEGDVVVTADIFRRPRAGAQLVPTGIRPHLEARLEELGLASPSGTFREVRG